MLGATIGCALYFARNIAPPRALALALTPLAMAAMFLAPAYRSRTLNRRWDQVRQIPVSETLHNVLSGNEGEFWTEAYLMEIADTQGLYQFGAGFYNTLVQYFVPKMIVGEDFKAKLTVNLPTARTVGNNLGLSVPYGMVPTGPYSVFEQFWYFGVACYFFLARWLRRHWNRVLEGDFWSQVVYAMAVTNGVAAVTNDIFAIYVPLFMFIVPVWAVTAIMGSMRLMAQPYCLPAPVRTQSTSPTSRP